MSSRREHGTSAQSVTSKCKSHGSKNKRTLWQLSPTTSQANLLADGSETGMRVTQCDFRQFTAIHSTEWQRACTFFSPLVRAKTKHFSHPQPVCSSRLRRHPLKHNFLYQQALPWAEENRPKNHPKIQQKVRCGNPLIVDVRNLQPVWS